MSSMQRLSSEGVNKGSVDDMTSMMATEGLRLSKDSFSHKSHLI